MKISEKVMNIKKISLKFKNMVSKGNVSGVLKLLTENMSNGILPLNDKTLKMLKQKVMNHSKKYFCRDLYDLSTQ